MLLKGQVKMLWKTRETLFDLIHFVTYEITQSRRKNFVPKAGADRGPFRGKLKLLVELFHWSVWVIFRKIIPLHCQYILLLTYGVNSIILKMLPKNVDVSMKVTNFVVTPLVSKLKFEVLHPDVPGS